MRIIGTIVQPKGSHEGRYLVEASGDELAKVMGFESQARSEWDYQNRPRFDVNTTIKVSDFWKQLHAVAAARMEMERAIKQIRAQADALEAISLPQIPTAEEVRKQQ